MGRAVSLLLFFLSALLFSSGFFLTPSHLQPLARLLSQTGTVHPAMVEKVELVPRLLLLVGVEFGLFALGWELRGKKHFPQWRSSFHCQSRSRQVWLSLGFLYLLISFLSAHFYGINLSNRWMSSSRTQKPVLPAGLPAEWIPVYLSIQQQTPISARILIKTSHDEKYLLNYLCYPRRFYFYPDPNQSVATIPRSWLQRYKIEWMLDIPADPARGYSLQPVSTSEGGHP